MFGNVSSIMKKAEELMRLGYMYEVFIRQGRHQYSVNCPDGQLAYNKRLNFLQFQKMCCDEILSDIWKKFFKLYYTYL